MIMKKCIIILFAIVALGLSSCLENDILSQDETINLNLKIEPFDMGTKSPKKDWAVGDKLNLWFDVSDNSTDHDSPDLIITYTQVGSEYKWIADGSLREGVVLKMSGKMEVLYEGYNDLSHYNRSFSYTTSSYSLTEGARLVPGSTVLYSHSNRLMVISRGNAYEFSSGTNTLTATLSGWTFVTPFKVLLTDLSASNSSKYQLQVYNSSATTSANRTPKAVKGFQVDDDQINDMVNDNGGWTGGVPDSGGGVAFYYFKYDFTNSSIKFTIYNSDNPTTPKYYSVSGKTLATSYSTCTGIILKYSDFGDEE